MEIGETPRSEERRGSVSLRYLVADPGVYVVCALSPIGFFPYEDPASEAPEPVQEGAVSLPELVLHLGGVRGGAPQRGYLRTSCFDPQTFACTPYLGRQTGRRRRRRNARRSNI